MTQELLPYAYNDGGRSKYYKGKASDCVCRAVAIASGKDYKEVYKAISKATGTTARNGQYTQRVGFKRLMEGMGFRWTPCSSIGSHMAVHPVKGELPERGRLVCSVAGHYFAVVDGVVNDIWDSRYNSFGQVRRIYGYWTYTG